MNSKQYDYVLTLAKEGSFSKAADVLGITQPSLSQYVKKIEKDLGVILFERSEGYVRTTDAGKEYIKVGKQIIDLEDQMKRKFWDIEQQYSGSIIIGTSPYRSIHFMPRIVKEFQNKYPGIHLVIEERAGSSLLEDAEHGRFNLCIATLPIDQSVFDYQVFLKEQIMLAVHKDTPIYEVIMEKAEKKGMEYPEIDLTYISDMKFITLSDNQPTQVFLNRFCQDNDIVIQTSAECRTIESQVAMVNEGIGVALIPSGVSFFEKGNNVAYFSIKQEVPKRDIAIIYRKKQYLSEPEKDLIELIMHIFKKRGQ